MGCSKFDDEKGNAIKTPTASFSMSDKEIFKGESVHFTNTSTNADRYDWDFGDNRTSTSTEPTHTFTQCGTYSVTLTAYNGEASDKTKQTVNVTSKTLEVTTISANCTGSQYYPSGKSVNGKTYKYEFTITTKCSYYGYKYASRWGYAIGDTYYWEDATKDMNLTFVTKYYTNNRSLTVYVKAYGVKIGGSTYGDVFGAEKAVKLSY